MLLDNALKIDGWMLEEELQWIAEIAKKCNTIIEVGCYKGRSTRCWLDNCPGTVIAIDPWFGMGFMDNGEVDKWADFRVFPEFVENVGSFLSSGKLVIMKSKFAEVHDLKADLVFIDGDHREEFVRNDIAKALSFLNPKGIIAGHDYGESHWPAVKRVVDEMFPDAKITNHIWYKELA